MNEVVAKRKICPCEVGLTSKLRRCNYISTSCFLLSITYGRMYNRILFETRQENLKQRTAMLQGLTGPRNIFSPHAGKVPSKDQREFYSLSSQ